MVSPATAARAWPASSASRSQNPHPTPGIASPHAHRASAVRGSHASPLGGTARLQDALLHPGAALTHGGEQQGDLQQQQLLGPRAFGSRDLCVIVGLRNLLAYSSGAKLAAIQAGFHHLLMRCCGEAAAAMAAAAAAPGAGERKGTSATGMQQQQRPCCATTARAPSTGTSDLLTWHTENPRQVVQ